MKIHLLIVAVFTAAVFTSNATLPLPIPKLVTKEWHMSPPKAPTSRFFGVIEWDKLPIIKVGLSEKELQKLSILNPFEKMDVLLYSTSPRGITYEIGILMADGRVADLSYKDVSESFENSILGSEYFYRHSNAERKNGEQDAGGNRR